MKCRIWKRIALGSLVVCVVLGVAVLFIAMANKPYEIPYDGNNIVLEQQGDDYFVTYNGRGNLLLAYTCNNLDEGECEIVFYQTLWDRYISPLLANETSVYKLRDMGEITKFISHHKVIWSFPEEETNNISPVS